MIKCYYLKMTVKKTQLYFFKFNFLFFIIPPYVGLVSAPFRITERGKELSHSKTFSNVKSINDVYS